MTNTAEAPIRAGIPAADAAAVAALVEVERALDRLNAVDPAALSGAGLLGFEVGLAGLRRRIDAAELADTTQILVRSDRRFGLDGLAARNGCGTPARLVEQLTGVSARAALQRVRVAGLAGTRTSDTGLPLPPLFPAVAAAIRAGRIGIDTADAITGTLHPVAGRAGVDDLSWAETTLISQATGTGTENGMPASADLIRDQAALFRDAIDPDGLEPRDEALVAARAVRFTRQSNGALRISGQLPPAQAAIVIPVFDAFLSPRTAPAFLADQEAGAGQADGDVGVLRDPRTRDQQRADVFTALCEGAAKTGQTPKLHGAAPTVLVTINTSTTESGTADSAGFGFGRSATGQPVPPATLTQLICDGGYQKVLLGDHGQVLDLGSRERFFSTAQRKAMIARDGPNCAHPGCSIPAYWAEAHHIIPWHHRGPTTIANGVLLCWFHHRLYDRGEWTISTQHGTPHFHPPNWFTNPTHPTRHHRT